MTKPLFEKEVKFYVMGLPALEQRLRQLGAVLVHPRTHELNYRFDTPDLSLTRSFQVLRLRQDDKVILAYKGPSLPDEQVQVRPEVEVEVDSFERAQSLLESLGFSITVVYEKWRASYSLHGLEVTLDELPFGTFSEIEGEDTSMILHTAASLGLSWDTRIQEGYLALFSNLKNRRKLSCENLTFEEFKEIPITPVDLGVKPADSPLFI